jgi:hypothetical protein
VRYFEKADKLCGDGAARPGWCYGAPGIRLRDDPANLDWQCDLAAAHRLAGDSRMAGGRVDEASKGYEASLAIWNTVVRSHPENLDWQRSLAGAPRRPRQSSDGVEEGGGGAQTS